MQYARKSNGLDCIKNKALKNHSIGETPKFVTYFPKNELKTNIKIRLKYGYFIKLVKSSESTSHGQLGLKQHK